ncbi:2-isopropylmalate synthase [Gemmatimonas sp.]|uniref:2-isopropylmalate synthase n=2 Tax=Gemmatimonas sp. TaxID=1962908 RepID=UPI0035698E21
MSSDIVRIFDTTLRDGEQAPGCSMTVEEKRQVARQLARLGVDVIEAGFPAASPGDWDAVRAIAADAYDWPTAPTICGLARATRKDIEAAATALAGAPSFRIHTFLATSDVHLQYKLQMTRERVLRRVQEMVSYAASFTHDVEFSPEDASRSDVGFLHEVLRTAIDAGATTLNIPDTVGYTTPDEYFTLIAGIRDHVVGQRGVTISTHCHDDLGLAVANSLAGVQAGARQVECTVNGIGERAGNAALEEVVMALRTRRARYNADTTVHTEEIGRASRLVSRCTSVRVPPNKAIVGANAFAHEAGIHQDGMLKNRETYEIMHAETVGLEGGRLVLGKHSGRAALRAHLATLGHALNDVETDAVFAKFKDVADRKKVVNDRELEAIVAGETRRGSATYTLVLVQVSCGTHAIPTATVKLRGPDEQELVAAAQGDGPVDAVCRAINDCVGDVGELIEFSVDAAAEGINAVGGVSIRLRERAGHKHAATDTERGAEPFGDTPATESLHTASGFGVHTDIIVATAEAYVAAVNGLIRARARAMQEVAA